jgi:serine/threonine-protein kinase
MALVAGGGIAAVVVGVARTRAPPPALAGAALDVAASTTAAAAALSAPSAPLATGASSIPPRAEPPARVVRVAIQPSTAQVFVDGKEATVERGSVEVAGALGSVHRVRVVAGGAETTGSVSITSEGALPAQVALEGRSAAKRPTLSLDKSFK